MSDPNPMNLDEVRTAAASLTRTTGCALPGCAGMIRYRTDVRGRRQRFCSGACRAKFSRERNRLHTLLGRIEDTRYLAGPSVPTKDVADLRQHVEWLLDGYGGVDRGLMHDGISPLPFATWEDAMNYPLLLRET